MPTGEVQGKMRRELLSFRLRRVALLKVKWGEEREGEKRVGMMAGMLGALPYLIYNRGFLMVSRVERFSNQLCRMMLSSN